MSDIATPDARLDEDEVLFCYRHPSRETALTCSNCGRPICTDCAIAAPVGIKCPECARQPRAARAAVPTLRLLRGAGAGVVLAAIGAIAFNAVGRGSFFSWFIAIGLGIAIAEGVRWATGGFRDRRIGQIAAAATAVAIAAPIIVNLVRFGFGTITDQGNIFSLVIAAVGAVYAYNRVS